MCASHTTWSPATNPPSPFANILDLLQGRTSLKQLPLALHYTHNIMYRYMQTHAHMHTRTHRDTDACMDECTHNVRIAGDISEG